MDILPLSKLSNSAIDRFEQCPLSFYHAYLNPEKPEQEDVEQFYADFGLLIHFLVEFYPRTNFYMDLEWLPSKSDEEDTMDNILADYGNQLMERGKPLTLDEMKTLYDTLFPLINFPNEETRNEYYQQGMAYIETIPEKDWSKVIGLEQKFEIDLQNGCVPITGIIDKVERDEKGLIITDYKTSKPYSENLIKRKRQLPIYGMAAYFLYGEIPYKYRYDFVRFGKVVEVEIPIERLTDVKNQVKFKYMQMQAFIKQGTFPASYHDFYCKNFCGYSRLCSMYKQINGE